MSFYTLQILSFDYIFLLYKSLLEMNKIFQIAFFFLVFQYKNKSIFSEIS